MRSNDAGRAKKRLGQHFLVDKRVAARIIESVAPRPSDVIVEIGPGRGVLTRPLVERSRLVIAIEIDRDLVNELQQSISAPNFQLIHDDALALDWDAVIASVAARFSSPEPESERLRIVANLPYNVATPIVQKLVRRSRSIFDMTLMLQDEVVDRLVAEPGGREYGYLTVLVRYYCEAAKLYRVRPSAFAPAPKVWSAVVRLVSRETPSVAVDHEEGFFSLVRAVFAQRRKTILNNLRAWRPELRLEKSSRLGGSGVDLSRRGETLTLSEFADLYEAIRKIRTEVSRS